MLLSTLIYLVVAWVVIGFALWLVQSAPFIAATVKPVLRWLLIAIGALLTIVLLLGVLPAGGPLHLGRC